MKIGRNEPCPCGSGKKFKHCCIGVTRSADALQAMRHLPPALPADRLYAQFVDLERRLRIATSNDVLFNQLRRDGPRIAGAFDTMCAQDLDVLNQEMCHFVATLAAVTTSEASPSDPRACRLSLLSTGMLRIAVGEETAITT